MTTTQTVLLVMTILAWLMMLAVLSTVVGEHPTGDRDIFNGLRWVVAWVLMGAAWLGIGGMLLVAGSRDVLPGWVQAVAALVWLASAPAAGIATYLVDKTDMRWPLAVPGIVPPLLAFYTIALYQPSLRAMTGTAGHAAVWGVVLALSVSVWAANSHYQNEQLAKGMQQARESEARDKEMADRKRAENLEKIAAMKPDQHLVDWYPLLEPDSGVRAEALEALKKVPRRQGDVIEGLGYEIPAIMRLLPELDLQPTPELCAAAKAYVDKLAHNLKRSARSPRPYQAESTVDGAVEAVRWLQSHGCDCSQSIAAMETGVGAFQDSSDRKKTLAVWAGLRQGH